MHGSAIHRLVYDQFEDAQEMVSSKWEMPTFQ
jgi:hypothetical protein